MAIQEWGFEWGVQFNSNEKPHRAIPHVHRELSFTFKLTRVRVPVEAAVDEDLVPVHCQ